MVPGEPGQAVALGREARRGEEVVAVDEDGGFALAVERQRDDRVDRLAGTTVILADRQQAPATRVEAQVGETLGALGRDRDRWLGPIGRLAVEAAVREVREDDRPRGDGQGAAAVLVDAVADVEARRGDVADNAVRREADDGASPLLGRSALEPQDVATVDPDLREGGRAAQHVLDADRRRPAPVRRDRRSADGHVPCCQDDTYARCSGVISSMATPSAASLSRATSASIASGTT